jgi:hypothetical protein
MRITSKKELKIYLLDRIRSAEIYRETMPTRYDALMDAYGSILNSQFLKYVDVNSDKESMNSIIEEFKSLYLDFMDNYYGVDPDRTIDESKSLRSIVEYLQKLTDSREKLIESWVFILKKWDTYPAYIKDGNSFKYIRKNLQFIITFLKNRYGSQQKSDKEKEQFKAIATEIALRNYPEARDGD